jgi:hypothetical protein
VTFGSYSNAKRGVLYAIYLKRTSEIARAVTDKKIRMTIAQAHGRLGHCG